MIEKLIFWLIEHVDKPYILAVNEKPLVNIRLKGSLDEVIDSWTGIVAATFEETDPEYRKDVYEALFNGLDYMAQKYVREEQNDQSVLERE